MLKGLFTGRPGTFEGGHYQTRELVGVPATVQEPRPPLLIGGGRPRVLRFAGREADIVFGQGRPALVADRTPRRRASQPTPPSDRQPPSEPTDLPVEHDPDAGRLTTVERLDEVPGIAERAAQIIIAEIGLDMNQFPTPGHLVSWAKLSPQTIQSGPKVKAGRTGKENRYLKGVLGEVATAAAKTDTFLGARYRRLVRRRGKQRALVAVSRSILVIVWHLLNDPDARYVDLGSDYYTNQLDADRHTRDLVRQLQALGHTVTLDKAA